MISVNRCAVGQPHDVLQQVGGNRRLRVGDRDRAPGREHRAVLPGLAVDEVLADQRLRARLAEGVGVERAEAALGHLHGDDRRAAVLLVEVDRLDRAGADAGDLEVGAGDEAERVVELDLVRARRAVPSRAAGDRRRDRTPDGTRARRRAQDPLSFAGRDLARVAREAALGEEDRAALHRAGAAVALERGQPAAGAGEEPDRPSAELLGTAAARPSSAALGRPTARRRRPRPGSTPPLASIVPGCE